MRELRSIRTIAGLLTVSALAACGDAGTTDNRGYTKAPLEKPGLIISPEGSSGMDSLGTPVLPRDTLIPPVTPPATTTGG